MCKDLALKRATQERAKERSRKRKYDLYHARKNAGACSSCGGQPELGRHLCSPCIKKRLGVRIVTEANNHRRRGERMRAGKCIACGERPRFVKEGKKQVLCKECRDRSNTQATIRRNTSRRADMERKKLIYAAKKKLHICTKQGCMQEAAEGRTMCGFHLERSVEISTAHYQRKKAAA